MNEYTQKLFNEHMNEIYNEFKNYNVPFIDLIKGWINEYEYELYRNDQK